MIRKPVKDGLGNNVRDYIFNPAENKFEHKDELVHVSSSDLKVGSPAHKQKFPERYGHKYTSALERAAYPIPGTAPSEKINKEPLVKQFRSDSPDTYLTDVNQQRALLLATIEDAKPKPKKTNPYAEVKIAIPTINHSLLRNSVADKAKAAAIDKMRAYAFKQTPNPDAVKGIGSFANVIGRKLRATESKRNWEKNRKTIYEDNSDA